MNSSAKSEHDLGGEFRTTHWSVVLGAAGQNEVSEGALETLCRIYWYPLYVFVRRRGFQPSEAQDLTQEFFARLISGNSLQQVHPDKGRFRTFLLASMKHFLANEWRDSQRLKRGGGREIISWEGLDPEERYRLEPETAQVPEAVFDRRWAQTLVASTLERLAREMKAEGWSQRFEMLKGHLQGESSSTYAQASAALGLSEPAIKSAIHRLRRRYAQLVREEIGQTVERPEEIESEMRHLITILAG